MKTKTLSAYINLTFLVILLLPNCGAPTPDFNIGLTRFYLVGDATPWDDLPKAMRNMMDNSGAPLDLWDVDVYFYPAYWEILEGAECFYRVNDGTISARVLGDETKNGCLAHEFAHKWSIEWREDNSCFEDSHLCDGFIEANYILSKALIGQ